MSVRYIDKTTESNVLIRKLGIFSVILLSMATLVRSVYSGWFLPLFVMPISGDGIRNIFSGINGYFLPGPLRTVSCSLLNHPYVSMTFYYSVFHPLCMTNFLGFTLIIFTYISVICIILLSLGMFDLYDRRGLFATLLIVVIFNWAPFYDGVLQGFPAEFIEILGIVFGFYLFLKGKPISAGIVLGFVSTIKVLPVIFLFYFAYKKQFKLVMAAIITGLILSAVILWRENLNPELLNSIITSIGRNAAYGHDTRDAGLNAFIHFVFHRSFGADVLIKIHYAACLFLALFFMAIELRINTKKNRYLFGLAAVSLAMFHVSPHTTEMYWYILLLPAIIFNIWMLMIYRDKIFGVTFIFSYVFMHGFSLLSIFFRIFRLVSHFFNDHIAYADMYLNFNKHGGIFIGVWLLYFSTYGLALKYLVRNKRVE